MLNVGATSQSTIGDFDSRWLAAEATGAVFDLERLVDLLVGNYPRVTYLGRYYDRDAVRCDAMRWIGLCWRWMACSE